MSKILLLGANGQVGSALYKLLGDRAIACTRAQADLSDPQKFSRQLEVFAPAAVINAAAYTAVDKAESERELAFRVNGISPGIMAEYCRARDIPLVHYSTDYVFDGAGANPHAEEDPTDPLNVYGESKLAGEQEIQRIGGKYWIFRTSWVFDAHGKNFFNTMLRLGAEREELRIVSDQIGAPTYAPHLATTALSVLDIHSSRKEAPYGLYHLCHSGETSWHGFAEAIFQQAKAHGEKLAVKRVIPIKTAEYPTPAQRPHNSRLSCKKAADLLGITLPPWQEGLRACMEERYERS